mmetsp:Transcript_15628/g.48894  ORF Transcript_15628/g.48894 Transcript_15628/m.48894 type:complete len:81 (-) Transcript_15628:186-428(-)
MKLFVMAGPSGPTLAVDVEPSDKILEVKSKLEQADCGIKAEKQVIRFKGKALDDDGATLSSYGIEVDHTLRKQSVSVSDH